MQSEPWAPLAAAIAPHVGKPFAELPAELQERIAQRGGWLAHWDMWEPEQRLTMARQNDEQDDPARQTENEARFFTGFWEATKQDGKGRVKFWLDRKAVTADEAARLLCDDDPIENPQDRAPAPLNAAFNLLHRAFCEAAKDGRARTLCEWVALAQAAGLGRLASVESWAACCTVFAGESKPAAPERASDEPQDAAATDERSDELRTARRRDLLAPLIEAAQRECDGSCDAAAVWPVLVEYAKQRCRPLIDATDEGIKWTDGDEVVRFFKLKNLRDRLRRGANPSALKLGKTR